VLFWQAAAVAAVGAAAAAAAIVGCHTSTHNHTTVAAVRPAPHGSRL